MHSFYSIVHMPFKKFLDIDEKQSYFYQLRRRECSVMIACVRVTEFPWLEHHESTENSLCLFSGKSFYFSIVRDFFIPLVVLRFEIFHQDSCISHELAWIYLYMIVLIRDHNIPLYIMTKILSINFDLLIWKTIEC